LVETVILTPSALCCFFL